MKKYTDQRRYLVALSDWYYIKGRMVKQWQRLLDNDESLVDALSFNYYVELAIKASIKFNQYGSRPAMGLLQEDEDLAIDIFECIDFYDPEALRSPDLNVDVVYIPGIEAVVLNLDPVNIEAYDWLSHEDIISDNIYFFGKKRTKALTDLHDLLTKVKDIKQGVKKLCITY